MKATIVGLWLCLLPFFVMQPSPVAAQRGINCDASCGGSPVDPRASIINQRGMGSLISPSTHVGKTNIIEGSQSFSYAVPLFNIPGRNGLNLNLTLYYNSAIWTQGGAEIFTMDSDLDNPSPGFRLDFGFIDPFMQILVDPDGTTHALSQASPSQLVTTDGTYTSISVPNTVGSSPLLASFKNGMQVTYTVNGVYRPTQIEDTNGNVINISYLNNNASDGTVNHRAISSITDDTGRTLNFIYDSATHTMLQCITTASTNCTTPGATTYTFIWNNGTSTAYNLKFNFNSVEVSMVTNDVFADGPTIKSGQVSYNILTGVVRPDGTSVTFTYGDWGLVTGIQELSKTNQPRYSASYNYPSQAAGTLNTVPTFTQESISDGVNSGTWNYQSTLGSTTNVRSMVTQFQVTDPCGTTTTTDFSTAGNAFDGLPTTTTTTSAPPSSPPATCPTVPTQTWRTLTRSWTSDSVGNPLLGSTSMTLDDNSESQTVYKTYDANGNATDIQEYDIGAPVNGTPTPGPLIRETITSYASLANHILNRPADVQLKDGKGNLISHSKFNYDEVATKGMSPLPVMHDETNYAPSSTTARGNLTSSVVYTNAAGGSGAINSSFTFDEFGNLIASTRGCCIQQQSNYSNTTAYAYPDSVSTGPSGSGLTTTYTYNFGTGANFGFGTVATIVDPNGQKTSLGYDIDNRITSTQTPDLVTTYTAFDDSSANPGVTGTNSANSLVAKTTFDGKGRTLSSQISNGSSAVSTKTFAYNIVGELLQSSNPFGPNDSAVYTTYGYDALGRAVQTTPPVLSGSSSQNPYQVSFSGPTITTTDPAGKLRKQYMDALARVVRVDEPGLIGAQNATSSLNITGSEQSVATQNGNGATAGTASVALSGSERSTVVLTHAATSASVTITVGGSDSTNVDTVTTCTGVPPHQVCTTHTFNVKDTGNLSLTVNAAGTQLNTGNVAYGGTSTQASLASALYSQFPSNSLVTASNPNGGNTFTLTAVTPGSAGNNYTFSTSIVSSCVPSDNWSCVGPGWTITPSSGHFAGGTDNVNTTEYDTGAVTVSMTINGTQYSKASNYSQNSTSASIANDLSNQINGDTTLNKLIIAGVSGSTLQLTTTATGAGTNYPFSVSDATNSQYFASGSTSFPDSPSGSTFTPGQNGTLYDSGTIQATLTGFTEAPLTESVTFGQGSTPASIATGLAAAFHNDPSSPVDASAASGSSSISFTAHNEGTDANNYSVTIAEQSANPSSFPTPSFATVSTQLSGGAAGTPSLDPSVVLTTTYTYDPLGDLLQVNQGQQTRSYQYDGLGRMISSTIPETGYQSASVSYTDLIGISQTVDPRVAPGTSNHLTASIGYDSLNRPQTITYSDGTPTVTYIYNPAGSANNTGGRLASVGNGVASETYQYDIMGRIAQCQKTIAGQTYTTKYAYNPDGSPSSISYPSGRTVNFGEDGIGRLTQIGTNGSSLLSINSYSAAGAVLSETYGNGISGTYAFNNQLQLATIQYGGSSALLNLAYNYGGASDNGQIQGITDYLLASRSASYTYDELGRLKVAQTNDVKSAETWAFKYYYDRFGNRLGEIPFAGTASMSPSEVVVDPTTNHITTNGVAYDAAGNMSSDGLYNYNYNILNQMTSVAPAGNGTPTATFNYDANGLRVIKNSTVYVYSGSKVIAEYASGAAASAPSIEYVYRGGLRLATITNGTTTYQYADHLSVRAETDASGNIVRTYGHFPFGGTWYETGTPDKWKFTTYENDIESGLNYASARFQSPRIGRFTSLDPLSGSILYPQSLNRFAYVLNDPINATDPTGADCQGSSDGCVPGGGPNYTCLLDANGDCGGGGGGCSVDGQMIYVGCASIEQSGFASECPQCGILIYQIASGSGIDVILNGNDFNFFYPNNADVLGDSYQSQNSSSSASAPPDGFAVVGARQQVVGAAFDGSIVPGSVNYWVSAGGTMDPIDLQSWITGWYYQADLIDARFNAGLDTPVGRDFLHDSPSCPHCGFIATESSAVFEDAFNTTVDDVEGYNSAAVAAISGVCGVDSLRAAASPGAAACLGTGAAALIEFEPAIAVASVLDGEYAFLKRLFNGPPKH